MEEEEVDENVKTNADQGTDDQDDSSSSRRDAKRTEEWMSEEALQFWEIRSFFDRFVILDSPLLIGDRFHLILIPPSLHSLLPIDSDYPPPLVPLALTGLPSSLVEEALSVVKKGETEGEAECRGSWIQPARCPSPEALRPPSPKPPSPPPPPPPPPSVVVMETPKPMVVSPSKPPIAPSGEASYRFF